LKNPNVRRFMVFTAPHAGDPKWETPVVELEEGADGKPGVPIEYQDTKVIEQVILDLSRDRARAAGFNAGGKHVLKTFGLTLEDFKNKLKANQGATKKPLDNAGTTPVESKNGN